MLQLINAARIRAGLDPVELGNNAAAQLHAEATLKNCFLSHWGVDGLKPYMRYSLAGGYQSNGENTSGLSYCIRPSDGYRRNGTAQQEISEAMDGLMASPGHRENILDRWHRKVNIGLAWDDYNYSVIQHFEGDYIEYDRLPEIRNGTLSLAGTTKNGVTIKRDEDLGVQIYYDPPPHPLTRGQVVRTYCYDSGLLIAALRPPLPEDWFYTEDEYEETGSGCPDPYDVPWDAPAPQSAEEADALWQSIYDSSRFPPESASTVRWITAALLEVQDNTFAVRADLGHLISIYGSGVYTITLWGAMDDEDVVISTYSIFHDAVPPDTYHQPD